MNQAEVLTKERDVVYSPGIYFCDKSKIQKPSAKVFVLILQNFLNHSKNYQYFK